MVIEWRFKIYSGHLELGNDTSLTAWRSRNPPAQCEWSLQSLWFALRKNVEIANGARVISELPKPEIQRRARFWVQFNSITGRHLIQIIFVQTNYLYHSFIAPIVTFVTLLALILRKLESRQFSVLEQTSSGAMARLRCTQVA